MTVIRHNSISGIVSITAAAGSNLSFYDSTGSTLSLDTGDINAGVITATTANFTNATVTGDLTVQGTTTTLDTTVTEVDKLEVGANNTTVGVAITQSGTGDILRLYDSSTQVVTVADGGSVGIGTDNPIMRLHVHGAANSADSRIRLSSIEGSGLTIRAQSATENNINADSGEDITFSRGNVESLRITSAGNIGIGLTNPQTALVVEKDWINNYGSINIKSSSDVLSGIGFRTDGGYAGGFIYRDGTTGNFFELNAQGSREIRAFLNGSEAFRVDTGGRLLLGTTSDKSIGSDANALVQIFTGSAGKLLLGREDSVVVGDEYIGLIDFHSTDGGSERCARISCQAEEIHGTGTKASRLSFMTSASGSATPTERLRIASTGAFGLSGANYGTSGQVLTSQGSGSAPQWATVNAGLTYLGSATLSGTSTSLDGVPSTARLVIVTWENASDTGGNSLRIRVRANASGTVSSVTSGYQTSDGYYGGGSNGAQYARTDAFDFGGAGMGGSTYDGRLTLTRLNSGNTNWYGEGTERQSGSSNYHFQTIGNIGWTTGYFTGVEFLCPASFDAGVIYIHYL